MVPIGICSIVALATFLERVWALRKITIMPPSACLGLLELLRQQRWQDALTRCRSESSVVARIVEVALEAQGSSREDLKERVQEAGRREAAEMERYIPLLGTIASIAPLLGLLGTVGGMIVTFQVIQDQGMGNVGSLAGGISQALITTFAGLCVGIPAVVANRYLLARVDRLLLELEEFALDVVGYLTHRDDSATSETP